mmetsp:Transcript_1227/g.2729  ORF Transcript_1227/g.2729 Transcript_1227/m.2729 type:complete len:234 (-) Transcript_1227:226-927(-)|eukprot:CAMPEP_0114556538 /NCGR_PEP_ID=MMETSP0114-20121206/9343_1 /TAXON_ID=31324 /ORGANISM="Goniomonas sp, Strain m" /LENGTH=233 /DNA_ID=CAMNT_0001741751 /DNA_START=220 /DNA_END=921 /DNA_ORIENTATION=-
MGVLPFTKEGANIGAYHKPSILHSHSTASARLIRGDSPDQAVSKLGSPYNLSICGIVKHNGSVLPAAHHSGSIPAEGDSVDPAVGVCFDHLCNQLSSCNPVHNDSIVASARGDNGAIAAQGAAQGILASVGNQRGHRLGSKVADHNLAVMPSVAKNLAVKTKRHCIDALLSVGGFKLVLHAPSLRIEDDDPSIATTSGNNFAVATQGNTRCLPPTVWFSNPNKLFTGASIVDR